MAPETLYGKEEGREGGEEEVIIVRERPTPSIDKDMYKKLQIRLPKDQQAKGKKKQRKKRIN